jgi:hypothetical protein
MTTIQIHNVPDDVATEYKRRAEAVGKSLESYLLDKLVHDLRRPAISDVMERARRRAAGAFISPENILAALDEGRASVNEHY